LDEERTGRIPLFSPPGMFEHALQLEEKLPQVFDPQTVELGESFEAGPFRVRTAPMRHPVPTLGMRIETDGSALSYTADTGPTEELVSLARDADLLLSEATWLDRKPGWEFIHLTAPEAGEQARRAEVGRLLLTHIWPAHDRGQAAEMAAAAFGAEVGIAVEGMKVSL
jgi:ribonuclease BN (tRNA processing enzyme)